MSSERELPADLDRLAEEFVARDRKGEHPSITEYVQRYPEFESGIREVFPLLAVMEGVKAPSEAAESRGTPDLDPEIRELGDYRLVGVVGRGGMGVVYEAEQKTLGRRVALKVLPPEAMRDDRFVDRFRIEAQAAASLQHPHIVPVIGLGEDRGIHYYAMQFIEGRGLDEIVNDARGLLRTASRRPTIEGSGAVARLFTTEIGSGSSDVGSISESTGTVGASTPGEPPSGSRPSRRRFQRNVARIGLQTAEALAFAHSRGVLHRDVKPSNVLLDEHGHAWITDFGLCLQEESQGLTRSGDLVGTLRYIAPEGFRGVYDVRGDIYGLGITLYELLTGVPAFADADRATLVRRITQEVPPKLRSYDATIPADLGTIIHKSIAPDPDLRYATAEAMASDLRSYLAGRPIAARAPSIPYLFRAAVQRNRPLAAAIASALVLLFLGAAFYVRDIRAKEASARLAHYAANIAAAETALRDGDVPRARLLLETAPPEFRSWEWRHLTSRLEQGIRAFPSLSPNTARRLAYSPDGRWLAVGGDNDLVVYEEAGARRVASFPIEATIMSVAWSPDSTILAVGERDQLVLRAWPEGREVLRQAWPDWITDVLYHSDGTRLYVAGEDSVVQVLNTQDSRPIASASFPSKPKALALSPDGTHLAVGRVDGRISLLDATDLRESWRRQVSPRGIQGVAFVGNDLVAGTAYDGAVQVLTVADGQILRILPHEGDLFDVAGDPRGRLLATAERGGRLNLWDARTGRRFERRSHGREPSGVAFRPDGLRVVTTSWAGTVTEWDASSPSDRNVLAGHMDDVCAVAIHPDGRLAASGDVAGVLRLWDLDTGALVRTWFGQCAWVNALAFSPDGRFLACADNAKKSNVLVRRTVDGAIVHRLQGPMGGSPELSYTRNGEHLVCAGYDGTLTVWDVPSGRRRCRLPLSPEALLDLALSPEGRWIAAAGVEKKVFLVDTATWTLHGTPHEEAHEIRSLAFHPLEPLLAIATAAQTIRLWDTRAAETRRVLTEPQPDRGYHTDALQCVAFHPDGSRLVSGSRRGNIDVWDWEHGQRLSTLRGHRGWIHDAVFTRDGDRLLTCSTDRTVRVWGVRSASESAPTSLEARRRRDAAVPRIEALYARDGNLDNVIATVEADTTVDPATREALLRVAHERRSSHAEQKRWIWRQLAAPAKDREAYRSALAVARGFTRAAEVRLLEDAEACLLTGIAAERVKPGSGRYYLDCAVRENAGTPSLQAAAYCFLVLSCGAAEDWTEAEAARSRLDALLQEYPEALTPHVRGFRAEADRRRAARR